MKKLKNISFTICDDCGDEETCFDRGRCKDHSDNWYTSFIKKFKRLDPIGKMLAGGILLLLSVFYLEIFPEKDLKIFTMNVKETIMFAVGIIGILFLALAGIQLVKDK